MSVILIVHLIYKVLRDFPESVHSLLGPYRARRHGAEQVHTTGVQNSDDGRVFTAEWWITMSVILNRTPSVQGATGLPRMRSYTACGRRTASAAMVLYQNSLDSRVFTAEGWITMSVILNCISGVKGAAGLPRMCTKPVGDVQPWSCTAPYSGCTKIPLTAECSTARGE